MENRNNILKELRELSPVVAGIGHYAPYTVPAGYFEGLADQLLLLVKAETVSPVLPKAHNPYEVPQGYFESFAATLLKKVKGDEVELSSALQQANNNPYQIPQGYFESLAGNLLQRVKEEAISLSPALQQANSNPYEVPQDYFETFAATLLKKIKGSAIELSPVLQQANNNPYQVPQGYFESLAGNLLQRVKEEAVSLSPALQQANTNPYQVPQNYFDNLPATILNRIKASATDDTTDELEILSPLLSQIGKKMPFSTPAGYFDEVGDNAIAGAQAIAFVNDELENLSPLMSGLKRIYVYEIPAGYFDQLPGQVMKAIKAQQPAKVVSMNFTRNVLRYAAAAVVAGLIVTAGWFYLGNTTGKTTGNGEKVVAVAAAGELDSISDEMLTKYLESQTPTPAEATLAANTAVDELDATDMRDLLADVTDEDLQQYLEKYNTLKDIHTN